MRPAFDLIDYQPGEGSQASFIKDSAWRSLKPFWPYSDIPRRSLLARVTREMAELGTVTKIITPIDSPDDYVGWASARPAARTIVMMFIKPAFRGLGIARMALDEFGIQAHGKIGIVFMTPVALDIKAGGGCCYDLEQVKWFDHARWKEK